MVIQEYVKYKEAPERSLEEPHMWVLFFSVRQVGSEPVTEVFDAQMLTASKLNWVSRTLENMSKKKKNLSI